MTRCYVAVLALCCWGYALPIFAQSPSGDTETVTEAVPRLVLKHGTSSFLNPVIPSLNVGLERAIFPQLSVHIEAGLPIPFRYFNSFPIVSDLSGYRARAALRFYFEPVSFGTATSFVELFFNRSVTNASVEGDFNRATIFGDYFQLINYNVNQEITGIYANYGLQVIEQKGFVFETGVGIGGQYRRDTYKNIPADARFITNGSNIFNPERRGSSNDTNNAQGKWTTVLFLHFSLGFAIR